MLDLIKIRHDLHRLAEISLEERKTANYLKKIIHSYSPSSMVENLGGESFAAVFKNGEGPVILFRADLDALPINETINCPYSSQSQGISHKCGHDGHMASLLSLLDLVNEFKGTLILFFQSAEEIGVGAKLAIESKFFNETPIDFVFSFHNLPNEDMGKVYLSDDVFSCASVGLKIKLLGQSSHASEPEKAISPHQMISELIALSNHISYFEENENFKIMTITHITMGEKSFGITPGNAEIFTTLRAYKEDQIHFLKEEINSILKRSKLNFETSEYDFFPSTNNNKETANKLIKIFNEQNIRFELMNFPNRWSEDFGYFTKKFKGVYLGIGAGLNTKPLHHPEYDFPDELILKVKKIYSAILLNIKND